MSTGNWTFHETGYAKLARVAGWAVWIAGVATLGFLYGATFNMYWVWDGVSNDPSGEMWPAVYHDVLHASGYLMDAGWWLLATGVCLVVKRLLIRKDREVSTLV
ncbi:MAG: hypothetical protein ACTHW1_06975 [Ancrocorticia sp.]|uniref:hypothetical protein n=1 Tax=Ancrocorticia sp. TaxID=2593684 RepID=UPI003F91DBFB